MITITVNGQATTLQPNTSVTQWLSAVNLATRKYVIEYNQQPLLPREYDSTLLQNQDQLEIIELTAGG